MENITETQQNQKLGLLVFLKDQQNWQSFDYTRKKKKEGVNN